jgi:hypothetical protein
MSGFTLYSHLTLFLIKRKLLKLQILLQKYLQIDVGRNVNCVTSIYNK